MRKFLRISYQICLLHLASCEVCIGHDERSYQLPSNPTDQSQIDATSNYMLLANGSSILVGDDRGAADNDRILLFSTSELVKLAGKVSR